MEAHREVPTVSLRMVRNAVERNKDWPNSAAMRINKALTQAGPGPGALRGTLGSSLCGNLLTSGLSRPKGEEPDSKGNGPHIKNPGGGQNPGGRRGGIHRLEPLLKMLCLDLQHLSDSSMILCTRKYVSMGAMKRSLRAAN